jgi:ParB-like chromosome segregation protein Spo0J
MLIYVPVKRRATLDPKKVQEIAESILQVGLQSPILVRQDGERFVLVSFCGSAASVGGVQATGR